jgi:predicted GNAT family N-acyltransferase
MSNITIRHVTSDEDLQKCFDVRTRVFVEEQNVSVEEEIDGLDKEAEQFLLWVETQHAATSRIRYVEDGKVAKIERVACLKDYRGLRLGQKIMEFLITHVKEKSTVTEIRLGAQCTVIGFYEKLGFTAYGDVFLDAAIDHRWMKMDI